MTSKPENVGDTKNKKTTNRIQSIRDKLNKKAGMNIAFNLNDPLNPTNVKMWIPTGSRWLDSIIASPDLVGKKRGGIPSGKVVELSGLESSGKSYMALQIAKNAQAMGFDVVYFDSESSLDVAFCSRIGLNVDDLIYTQATTVEKVFEIVEELLAETTKPILFIWDSYALTPSEFEVAGGFDPQKNVAVKARVSALGLSKLVTPLANVNSSFLVINQLKTNIDVGNPHAMLSEPYVTPGGKALVYAASLRIWLTRRKAKKWFIEDENGDRIGSDVKVVLKKNRFGQENRSCNFKILWGDPDNVSIYDEESWFDAIKPSRHLKGGGAGWWKLNYVEQLDKDTEVEHEKFQGVEGFLKKLKAEPKFKKRVLEVMDEVVIFRKP